jgi:hypothetical protein
MLIRPLEQIQINENPKTILSDWKNFSDSKDLRILKIKMPWEPVGLSVYNPVE